MFSATGEPISFGKRVMDVEVPTEVAARAATVFFLTSSEVMISVFLLLVSNLKARKRKREQVKRGLRH